MTFENDHTRQQRKYGNRGGLERKTPSPYEQHRMRVKNRKDSFYTLFSVKQQEALEESLLKWPAYANGNPFPGMRKRFSNILGLDPNSLETRELCNSWMELVGWSIVGRKTWVDREGVVWGPSPISSVDANFPYTHAVYDEGLDTWLLSEDHELYEVFFGKRKKRTG